MENIYRILNDFNNTLGKKVIYAQPYVWDSHIYIQMLYDEHTDRSHNSNFGMVRIWVTRNKKNYQPEFILWKDNIYINDLIMTDKENRLQFFDARDDWAGGLAEELVRGFDVSISNKMLNDAIHSADKHIKDRKRRIANENDINELSEYCRGLDATCDAMRILLEERDRRILRRYKN